MNTLVFAIETSCDETSVAILNDKRKILSHITVNQKDHNKFGGVVPEIASRAHLEILQTIIPNSLKEAGISINDIDLFCATCGPGLIGGLLIGSTVAKMMAIGVNKPFYPINHLEGHIISPKFNNELIKLFKKAGIKIIYVGIESADEKVLIDSKRTTIKFPGTNMMDVSST